MCKCKCITSRVCHDVGHLCSCSSSLELRQYTISWISYSLSKCQLLLCNYYAMLQFCLLVRNVHLYISMQNIQLLQHNFFTPFFYSNESQSRLWLCVSRFVLVTDRKSNCAIFKI